MTVTRLRALLRRRRRERELLRQMRRAKQRA